MGTFSSELKAYTEVLQEEQRSIPIRESKMIIYSDGEGSPLIIHPKR